MLSDKNDDRRTVDDQLSTCLDGCLFNRSACMNVYECVRVCA